MPLRMETAEPFDRNGAERKMIEEKRRRRRLRNRDIGEPRKSSAAPPHSTATPQPERPHRPKLRLKIPSDSPVSDT